MTAYQWCELALGSDIVLPELRQAPDTSSAPDWRIRLTRDRAPLRDDRHWFHHWRFPDGRRWLSLARHAGGYLLRFPTLADFDVQTDAREIHCYRGAGTPLRTLRHLLLDQVLPLTAGGRDRLAVHASVIATSAGAVVFLGAAGHGKSTLAARLAQRGCSIVSDDCCLLRRCSGGFDVAPSYPGVRLAPDSIAQLFAGAMRRLDRVSHYSSKRRIARPAADLDFCEGAVPLRRLYALAPLGDLKRAKVVTIRARNGCEALLDLVNFTFHLDVGNASRIKDAFELAADVARSYDVRLLTFPWNLAGADAVADAVLSDLSLT